MKKLLIIILRIPKLLVLTFAFLFTKIIDVVFLGIGHMILGALFTIVIPKFINAPEGGILFLLLHLAYVLSALILTVWFLFFKLGKQWHSKVLMRVY